MDSHRPSDRGNEDDDVLILSIDTSTPHSSVCLADVDSIAASASLGIPQRHGEFIAPAIAFCLEQSGHRAEDVTGVAVDVGPGLYTGLRVGIMTAKSFASARHLPVVGLSGLDVLAFQLRYARRLVCATIDARRGELYWAFYRCIPGGVQRVTDVRLGSPDKLAGEIEGAGEECLVVGDGGLRYTDKLTAVDAVVAGLETAWPRATDLAELAVPRFVREETERPEDLHPVYLRKADARIGWESRTRREGGEA